MQLPKDFVVIDIITKSYTELLKVVTSYDDDWDNVDKKLILVSLIRQHLVAIHDMQNIIQGK